MKRVIKVLFSLFLTITMASIMFGCGNPTKKPVEENATVITFYSRAFEDWSQEYTKWAVDKFNEDLTDGIEVKVKFFEDSEYGQILAVGSENGTMPDVFLQAIGQMEARIDAGQIAPLDDLFTQEELDDVQDYAVSYLKYKGHWYAYPWMSEPNAVFMYRKSMLSAAGFEIPDNNIWTWADVLEACSKLKVAKYDNGKAVIGKGQYCIGIPYGPGMVTGMEGMAYHSAGKSILDPSWTTCQVDESWTDYYGFLYELFANGYTPNALISSDVTKLGDTLCENKMAMTITGSWAIAAVANYYSELENDIGFAVCPTDDGDITRITSINGGWNYCISSQCEHPTEAATFIKFMLRNTEIVGEYFKRAYYCKQPVLKTVRDYLDANHGDFAHQDWYDVVSTAVDTSIPQEAFPLNVHFAAMDSACVEIAREALKKSNKDTTIANAITNAQKTINQFLKADGWQANPGVKEVPSIIPKK